MSDNQNERITNHNNSSFLSMNKGDDVGDEDSFTSLEPLTRLKSTWQLPSYPPVQPGQDHQENLQPWLRESCRQLFGARRNFDRQLEHHSMSSVTAQSDTNNNNNMSISTYDGIVTPESSAQSFDFDVRDIVEESPSRATRKPKSSPSVPHRRPRGSSNIQEDSPRQFVKEPTKIELSPGVSVPFKGTVDVTWEAILDGRAMVSTCTCCSIHLQCIETVELVLCPSCGVVSPVDQSISNLDFCWASDEDMNDNSLNQSIGIGFTEEGIMHRMSDDNKKTEEI